MYVCIPHVHTHPTTYKPHAHIHTAPHIKYNFKDDPLAGIFGYLFTGYILSLPKCLNCGVFSEPIEITTFSLVNCISIIIKVKSTLDYFEES